MTGEGLGPLVVERYLDRLRVDHPSEPSLDALRALHRAHLRAVPFENADILRGEPLRLDVASLVDKILVRGRGGFCYELNGLFAELLEALGYVVRRRSARVFEGETALGPPFDHLCLEVPIERDVWLADVGFGYSFLEPLRAVPWLEQDDPAGRFRLRPRPEVNGAIDLEWWHGDGWRGHYRIEVGVHELADFAPMCEIQRSSPDSSFVRGWLLSRATDSGFVTIFGRRYVVSDGPRVLEERTIDDDAELASLVARWFDL